MATTFSSIERPILHERINAAWWGVAVLFLVHGLVVSTWVSRIAAVKARLGLSDGAFGLALFGAAVGAVTAIPLSGWAIDKYGSRRAVQWTAVGFCLSLVFLGSAPNLVTLFAVLFIYGAMTGANDVAINAQGVGVEKYLGRPTMSRFHAMFSLGGIVGSGIGGLVASRGLTPSLHFLIAAVTILMIVVATMPSVLDTGRGSSHSTKLSFTKPPTVLIALSAIGFCIFLSEGAIADWTAVYIRQVLHAGEGTAAAGYAAFSAAMTVFRLSGDAITARIGHAWTIRAGGLIAAFGLVLLVSADSAAVALTGLGITGAGFSSIIPVVFAAGSRIPSVSEAAGVATVSGVGYLGFIVGPPMIGMISELTSLRVALGVLVLLSCSAALLVSAATRYNHRVIPTAR